MRIQARVHTPLGAPQGLGGGEGGSPHQTAKKFEVKGAEKEGVGYPTVDTAL
jgi:hypothetical protein